MSLFTGGTHLAVVNLASLLGKGHVGEALAARNADKALRVEHEAGSEGDGV